jgi:hypothetical protein
MANEPQLVELGFDGAVLELINAERAKVGVKPLNDNGPTDDHADRHALDLAKNMSLSDTGSDGSTVKSRAKDAGYLFGNVGEAIAAGPMDPKAVVAQWMNDPTQRDQLLNPTYTDAGLGTVADTNGKLYWVEGFGGPDVAPAPAPAPAPEPTPVAVTPTPAPADPMVEPANPMTEPKKKGGKGKGMKKNKKDFGEKKDFFGKKDFRDKKDFDDKKIFGGDKKFDGKKMDKDPFGPTSVGDAKDFKPSKDPIGNPGNKNPMDKKICFGKDMNKFDDKKNDSMIGDVSKSQTGGDQMGAPVNPMVASDMMSAPQNPMAMH